MTDYQDNCARYTAEQTETAAHDLAHSSEPTGAAPTFQSVATAPAKTSDEALSILADEVVDFAQQDEAAHSRLADMAQDDPNYAGLSIEASRLEDHVKGRLTMAALVRADTPAGLAAKGRAALAFRKTLEGCVVDEAAPLLISMAEDAVRLAGQAPDQLWANQDAAVINAATDVRRLSIANDAIWGTGPELDDRHLEQIAWKAKADEASERFRQAVAHLATLRPVTPAGMAAKAAVAPALTSFWDFVNGSWHEADLMQSIAADALRLGAALAPLPADAELLALGAELERLWAAEEEAAECDDASADAALDRSRAVVDAIMGIQPMTLAGVEVRARAVSWGFNGEVFQDHGTGSELLHRFLSDLGALDAVPFRKPVEPPIPNMEIGVVTLAAQTSPDRLALESYRTWLAREHAALTHEMYPGVDEAFGSVFLNNPGARFHFRGEPPASSRAERILATVGVDWRNDPVADADCHQEQAA